MSFFWTCPYCDRDTTITDTSSTNTFVLRLDSADGDRLFRTRLIVCPNKSCKKFTLTIYMFTVAFYTGGYTEGDLVQTWNLIPPSSAKVFPDYVPAPIREDYVEACLIRDLSAKASATLSRRCLQGMIRDFWKISKPRLVDEIKAIKTLIDAETWKAVDAVRSIGNIGAHIRNLSRASLANILRTN